MPKILDACCGSRLFWFDKDCSFATYMDIREEEYEIHGKKINVKPDVVADFRDMPFEDNVYDLVVFDPPHLKWAGQNSIMKGQRLLQGKKVNLVVTDPPYNVAVKSDNKELNESGRDKIMNWSDDVKQHCVLLSMSMINCYVGIIRKSKCIHRRRKYGGGLKQIELI